jgi:pentose-5-phosphate-3-epimerase
MKISASIYSDSNKDLVSTVQELEHHHIDMLHLDCLDNQSVFADIKKVRNLSPMPIDLHLITANPSSFELELSETPVDFLTIQYENLNGNRALPTEGFQRLGLALTSSTPIEVFEEFAEQCSFVLLMATEPGKSGGEFRKVNFARIREFKSKFPTKRIHVDGGVNAEVSFILRTLGVHCAVSGSYLFTQKTVGSAVLGLKSAETESHYLVADFMRGVNETPVIIESDISLKSILRSIEEYKMAFTSVIDDDGVLKGIVSNADVRKGLLANIDDLNGLEAASLINRTPIIIDQWTSVTELLRFIRNQSIPINFLPVTNREGKLAGSLTFNDLIKGEA